MGHPSARSAAPHKCVRITLTLLLSVFRLMQCSHATHFSVNEVVGVRLPDEAPIGLRIDLVHTDSPLSPVSPGNITSMERLKRALKHSHQRVRKLQMSVDEVKEVEVPVHADYGVYLVKMAIGTPPVSVFATLDTGSDLPWTQCKPCSGCDERPYPIYDPAQSSTYSKIPCTSSLCQTLPMEYVPQFNCTRDNCEYFMIYGDGHYSVGNYSYESFTISSQSFPRIAFGCGHNNTGGEVWQQGLVGFARSPLSFISQLGIGMKFSYCFVTFTDSVSKTSPFFIGKNASFKAKTVGTTSILQSSSQPLFYYLSLDGISYGDQLLDIPAGTFHLKSNGSGGLIIDSGTTFTFLEQPGYDILKKAVKSSTNLPPVNGSVAGLDLCYDKKSFYSQSHIPNVTFHFTGADFVLPKENYITSDVGDIACLAMSPTLGMSIFGNIQQENYQILYDLERNVLSFAPKRRNAYQLWFFFNGLWISMNSYCFIVLFLFSICVVCVLL